MLLESQYDPPTWYHVEKATITVVLNFGGGVYLDWMGDEVSIPFDPQGPWHEIYPEYCSTWMCLDWTDANGNQIVDIGDWMMMIPPYGDPTQFYVEEIGTDLSLVSGSPPCTQDVNDDGVVDVLDLLAVLAAWGATSDVPEDINGDGVVDVLDLLEVLSAWGPCP